MSPEDVRAYPELKDVYEEESLGGWPGIACGTALAMRSLTAARRRAGDHGLKSGQSAVKTNTR
jgi:hypothetical protein